MAAVPKNKITRAERGKRRKGNTPSLIKNAATSQPQFHKRGFVAMMLKNLGLTAKTKSTAN